MPRIPHALALALLLAPPLARAQGAGGPRESASGAPSADDPSPTSSTPRPPGHKPPEDQPKKPEQAPKGPLPRAAVLEDVAGTVHSIDRMAHRIEIDTPSGLVGLSLDRNTLVYGPRGLVTPLAIQPGSQVRAGRNADFVAYWIAVRTPTHPSAPASTPDQGTGPGGGAGAPTEPNSGPAGTTSVPPSTVGPGSATPGPAPTGGGAPGP